VSLCPHAQRLIFLDATDSLLLIAYNMVAVKRMSISIPSCMVCCCVPLSLQSSVPLRVLPLTICRRNSACLKRKKSGRAISKSRISTQQSSDRAVYAHCHPTLNTICALRAEAFCELTKDDKVSKYRRTSLETLSARRTQIMFHSMRSPNLCLRVKRS
jgi:hypothetical protein